jgi:hypothetical protein
MPIIPFASRAITLQFALGAGQSFNSTGANILTVQGLRCIATFENALVPSLPTALIHVYGLTLDQINRLTVAGTQIYGPYTSNTNAVRVSAGAINGPMATIFEGTISRAYPDGQQPNMGFYVIANYSLNLQSTKIAPTSFQGSVSASTVMQTIAGKASIKFENNGVAAILSNPYFSGPAKNQMEKAAEAANAYLYYDTISGTAAVWPKPNGQRAIGSSITFSPATGMIGYPEFEASGIKLRTIWDPSLALQPGQKFQVQSQFAAACGFWVASNVSINIASQMPSGPWEMVVDAYATNFPSGAPIGPGG